MIVRRLFSDKNSAHTRATVGDYAGIGVSKYLKWQALRDAQNEYIDKGNVGKLARETAKAGAVIGAISGGMAGGPAGALIGAGSGALGMAAGSAIGGKLSNYIDDNLYRHNRIDKQLVRDRNLVASGKMSMNDYLRKWNDN